MNKLLHRIDEVIETEGLWRAKEILGSNISLVYDEALYLRYGELLYALGDKLESGKYFLLTSTENPIHHEAIELFLSRHKGNYFSHFPRSFKRISQREYPKNLLNEMNNNPLLLKDIKESRPFLYEENISKINLYLGGSLLVIMFGLMCIGFVVTVKYIWSFF